MSDGVPDPHETAPPDDGETLFEHDAALGSGRDPATPPAVAGTPAAGPQPEPEPVPGPVQTGQDDAEATFDPTQRYEHRGELGSGGVGSVACRHDRAIGRDVAYKTLHRDTPQLRARFWREARITGQLEHPNIVPVHDMGRDSEGRRFYTMRRIAGRTLGALLDDLRDGATEPTLQARIDMFLKACDAMAYAHERGVIHRDLKPENIMVGRFGRVLVVDWGLARVLADAPDTPGDVLAQGAADGRTLNGTVLGTPAYMPPEQAEGRLDAVDRRSDIYSLGAVLYELLTLERPFTGPSTHAVLARVLGGALVPPRERAPDQPINSGLEAAVVRAMAFDPAARFETVLALQHEVRRALAAGRIRDEIQLRRVDPSAALSGIIGLQRCHLLLTRAYQQLVAPWKLTPPQVNVLRIVHGSREEGVTFREIYERQVWSDPQLRGSLHRVLELGYVRSEGEGEATRYYATPAGQAAAEALLARDSEIEAWGASSGLTDDEWRTFSDLLARLRAGDLGRFDTWYPGAPGE